MKKIFIPLFIFLISVSAFAKKGGATSGGGDLLGIDAARVTEHVFSSIDTIGSRLYSEDDLENIHDIKDGLKIIMVDSELPVKIDDTVQKGSAYSVHEGQSSTIFLIKKDWNNINTLLEREVLIHHEIMVLAGLENTGDYHLSVKFENLRTNFWRLNEKHNVFCSINVFEKSNYYNKLVPGKLIGSSSSTINFVGARGDMGILATLANGKALIWRGIISSAGYFKMELAEAEYYKTSFFGKKRDPLDPLSVSLSSLIVKENEKIYFDPYQIEKPVSTPMVFGENYAVVVNCNKF